MIWAQVKMVSPAEIKRKKGGNQRGKRRERGGAEVEAEERK